MTPSGGMRPRDPGEPHRVAPVLELIVKDKYVWLPLDQVRNLKTEPPKKLAEKEKKDNAGSKK